MTSIPTIGDAGAAHDVATDADVYVLGGGAVGAAIARRLREEDHAATLVDGSHEPPDLPVHRSDPTDARSLAEAGITSASTVVVATASDSRNLLIAQLVRVRFEVDRVLVLVNEPDRVGVLADAGHEPLCATTTIADALVDQV